MSGFGIQPPGYGLDPYGDPFAVSLPGLLSANIYSMQFSITGHIYSEISKVSVNSVGSEQPGIIDEEGAVIIS